MSRALWCGLLAAASLLFACAQETNPPEVRRPGTRADVDGGVDAGEDAGTDAGVNPDGGGVPSDGGVFCIYSGAQTPTFVATARPGGLDRITIERELASDAPRCVRITLVNPPLGLGDGGLVTPAGWDFQDAVIRDRACSAGAGSGTTATATGIYGEVTFAGDGGGPYPASLSINAIVFGDPVNGFPPAQTCVSGVNLSVQ